MTKWALGTTERFEKEFSRLSRKDKPSSRRIAEALDGLRELDDPSVRCKPMTGPLAGLWRLRVGDWRVVLDIRRSEIVIVAVDVGHRSRVYR